MEKFVTAAGVVTRYMDIGRGENTTLLIHGYLESLDVWDSFAGQMGKSRRVIAIDLPGSGFSDWGARETISIDFMADVAADILRIAGVAKATVVGHSMGGYVATAMAELHPEKIEKLVLFHSAPGDDSDEKKANRIREIELVQSGKKELLASINPARGFAPQNVRRCHEAIEELAEQVMLTDDKAIIATLKGMAARKDRSDFFASYSASAPTMIIYGMFDPYIDAQARAYMIEKYPKAEVALLDNSGHMGFIEQPELALNLL